MIPDSRVLFTRKNHAGRRVRFPSILKAKKSGHTGIPEKGK
jgi:hypothetical protein